MKDKKIIRIGDRVRLIDPRRISRIGYEVTAESLISEVQSDSEVERFCQSQKLISRSYDRIIHAIAVSRMYRQMKDGAKKEIYFDPACDSLLGNVCTVADKKTKYTGSYYSADSGYDYSGEYDYTPAGLENRISHVCLKLNLGWLELYQSSDEFEGFWVTSNQVEKVFTEKET